MGNSKTIELRDKPVTVRELLLCEILEITKDAERPAVEATLDLYEAASSLTKEDIVKYYPSELQTVIDALVEVNKSFLEQAGLLKETGLPALFQGLIESPCLIPFTSLSQQDTAKK